MNARSVKVLAVAMCAALAVVAAGGTQASARTDGVIQPPAPPCAIHNDSQPLMGIGSYATADGSVSAIGLDDFVVPSSCVMSYIDAYTGTDVTSQPVGFTVTVYVKCSVCSKGNPYSPYSSQTMYFLPIGQAPAIEHLVLPSALSLDPGTYYVSVQASSRWFWRLNLANDGEVARWKHNVSSPYGSECYLKWGYLNHCSAGDLLGYAFNIG